MHDIVAPGTQAVALVEVVEPFEVELDVVVLAPPVPVEPGSMTAPPHAAVDITVKKESTWIVRMRRTVASSPPGDVGDHSAR